MGRRLGSKDKKPRKEYKPYTHSPLSLAQRRTVNLKHGLSWTRNTAIGKACDCKICPVRNQCPHRDKVEVEQFNDKIAVDDRAKCPLYLHYKDAVLSVLKNPITSLAKDIGTIEVKLQQQMMQDGMAEKPISKEFLDAMRLKIKAVEAQTKAQDAVNKSGNKRERTGKVDLFSDDEAFVDIDFEEVGDTNTNNKEVEDG